MSEQPTRGELLYKLRHSTAHIMAQAVGQMFPEAGFAIGPPIKGGFYYDFDLPRSLTDDDLQEVESRMRKIVKGNHKFIQETWSKDEARKYFGEEGQHYKLEIMDTIIKDDEVSIFKHDTFVDLCAGPHLRYTSKAKHFKLLRVSGAYWRGDSDRQMLQRIYGTVWPSRAELDAYLEGLEEAKRRDHRRLGRELDLFWFDDVAPGCPFWTPKGFSLYQSLVDHWRGVQQRNGYVEISNPLLYRKELYEQSGHWDEYRKNMFIMESHGQTMCLKPMNCPDTMKYFASRQHSYRDLPLRVAETSVLHRNELPGTLSGLTRVRQFCQDDAHIFVRRDQIQEEILLLMKMVDELYSLFGLEYRVVLSTRDPESFIGDPAVWDEAEAALADAIKASGKTYKLNEADAAFYGPKIDFLVIDSLAREWQTATIQLDFNLPERFNLKYTAADNTPTRPVVIHRACFGSFERFIGILIEHLAGAFPTWLAPVQAKVLSITNDQEDYCREVHRKLLEAGVRAELDVRGEKVGKKIAEAEVAKTPWMLVVGRREAEEGTVAVRTYSEGRAGAMTVDEIISKIQQRTADRTLDVTLRKNDLWATLEDVHDDETMEDRGF
jgi:threonyl-tRNA synthetase